MKRTHYILLGTMLMMSPAASAQTTKSSTSTEDAAARELLEMSGGGTLGERVIEQLISSFKKKLPNVPASFWDDLGKELDPTELVTLALPVYTKHYTVEEMRAIMAFYKTPAGAKLVQSMPEITQEMSLIGQKWGNQVGQKVVQRLQEKGYLKPSEKK
jgi:uncharacterized protein